MLNGYGPGRGDEGFVFRISGSALGCRIEGLGFGKTTDPQPYTLDP